MPYKAHDVQSQALSQDNPWKWAVGPGEICLLVSFCLKVDLESQHLHAVCILHT